jgi:hypothetical protein
MKYDEIANQADYRAASGLYVSEVYGADVVNKFPAVQDTLWGCVLMGMPESMAQLEIFIMHCLVVPEKK